MPTERYENGKIDKVTNDNCYMPQCIEWNKCNNCKLKERIQNY